MSSSLSAAPASSSTPAEPALSPEGLQSLMEVYQATIKQEIKPSLTDASVGEQQEYLGLMEAIATAPPAALPPELREFQSKGQQAHRH